MLRPPTNISGLRPHPLTGAAVTQHEIVAEQASSLGHAGRQAEAALMRLKAAEAAGAGASEQHLRAAARAVYAYFIQRELCGLRRHEAVIREMGIPRKVLVRLGAW